MAGVYIGVATACIIEHNVLASYTCTLFILLGCLIGTCTRLYVAWSYTVVLYIQK